MRISSGPASGSAVAVAVAVFVAATPAFAESAVTAKAATAKKAAPRLWFPGDAVPPKASDAVGAARELLTRHAKELHVTADLVAHDLVVDQVHDIGRGGILVAFRHVDGGVEVWRDALKVLLQRDSHALVAVGGQVHGAMPAQPAHFAIGPAAAMADVLHDVTGVRVRADEVEVASTADGRGYFPATLRASRTSPAAGIAMRHGRVMPVWAPNGDFVVPGYVVEIMAVSGGVDHVFSVVVDAKDGRVMQRVNGKHEAAFSYRVWADTSGDKRPLDSPLGDTTPYPLAAPDGHYPDPIAANLVTNDGFNRNRDPWIEEGATVSTGNNCDAFTDDGNPQGFSAGDVRAAVTSPGVFDHTMDLSLAAEDNDEQKMAGATSLFYLVNWEHDWWYDSGFDEAGHDAQTSNLGRGGVENDAMLAGAQFAAPFARDNSVMDVIDDGIPPEMQMFVWSGRDTGSLTAGNTSLGFNVADFPPSSFDVTADAILADDGTAPNGDACEAIQNDLTGKVALIDRGTCTFTSKVNAAQAAGAIAVIIVDNNPNDPGAPPVLGDDTVTPQPTIPVVSLSVTDGQALEAQVLAGPVRIDLHRNQEPDYDGGVDTTVAAHEWGHYLHLRQVSCGTNLCGAESEGWADFNALMTIVRDGDDLHGAFPVGVYDTRAFPDDPAYFGIRRYPYSVDHAKNPLTFKHIADSAALPDASVAPVALDNAGAPNSESHATGEIWASMMFESFIALLERSQQLRPPYNFEGARRRMGDIVEAGMKLAPADPTFTEMRDALLAGAITFDVADADAIAAAFARRGAGTCAVSPPLDFPGNEGVVEDFTVGGSYVITDVTIDDSTTSCDGDGLLDGGETGRITVTVLNASVSPLEGATVSLTSSAKGLHIGQQDLSVGRVQPFQTAQVSAAITLDLDAPPITHASITAKVTAGPACSSDGLTITPLTNGDDVADGLKSDSVEGTATVWTLTGDFADFIWARIARDDGNVVWAGGDADAPTDSQLVSPVLNVSASTDFVLSFKHRYQFEFDNASNYDGAVIEISSDGGATWNDIATVKDPGYNGTIGDTTNQATNPLKDRQGFVAQSAAFPDLEPVSVNLGNAFAGQAVQVRFRIATDEGTGADGWQLDDIAFSGIDNAPFSGLIDNTKACSAQKVQPPAPNPARAIGCGCGSSSPPELALGAAVLVVLAGFRRRRAGVGA